MTYLIDVNADNMKLGFKWLYKTIYLIQLITDMKNVIFAHLKLIVWSSSVGLNANVYKKVKIFSKPVFQRSKYLIKD